MRRVCRWWHLFAKCGRCRQPGRLERLLGRVDVAGPPRGRSVAPQTLPRGPDDTDPLVYGPASVHEHRLAGIVIQHGAGLRRYLRQDREPCPQYRPALVPGSQVVRLVAILVIQDPAGPGRQHNYHPLAPHRCDHMLDLPGHTG